MTDLERFLTDFMAKDHDSLAQDDDKWITIHPNGTDNRAVMIDDKTGVIKKGLAIGLIGTKLKDIRDNFKDKAKIEQHRARAEGEKAPEVKEPEKKEPEKKEDDSKTIEGYLLKNGGKLWNDRRIYIKDIAKKLLNVKDDYYNTGNLRSFEWEDGLESNSYGRKVLSAIGSSYFDVNSQTFKCDSLAPEIDKLVIDKLNEKAKEMGLTVKEKPVITGNTVKDQIRRFVVDGWNGKVYRYKNGDNAIFVNNQKILLTKEQLDYIDSKDKK